MRLLRPTVRLDQVRPDGVDALTTGNRALDAIYGFVDEDESRAVRETGLLEATLDVLRATPSLWRLGASVALVQVCLLAGLPALFVAAALLVDGLIVFVVIPIVILAYVALLYLAVLPLRQVLFAAAVSAGVAHLRGVRRGAGRLVADGVRTWSSLGRRAVAAAAGGPGAAYEALMVLVVPIRIAEGGTHADAQRRSEELVARRWGPGRFRALGLPAMGPQYLLYRWVALRYGYAAGRLFYPVLALVLFGSVFVVSLVEAWNPLTLALVGGAWGILIVGLLLWSLGVQPMIDGLLRAHLHHYAVTGKAAPPYTRELLHSCLREELRASLGMPQRQDGDAAAPGGGPVGIPGVLARLEAFPPEYLEHEVGVDRGDIAELGRDAGRLLDDARAIMRLVRPAGEGGLDAVTIARGVDADARTVGATLRYLVDTGMLEASTPADGVTRFRAVGDAPWIWEGT